VTSAGNRRPPTIGGVRKFHVTGPQAPVGTVGLGDREPQALANLREGHKDLGEAIADVEADPSRILRYTAESCRRILPWLTREALVRALCHDERAAVTDAVFPGGLADEHLRFRPVAWRTTRQLLTKAGPRAVHLLVRSADRQVSPPAVATWLTGLSDSDRQAARAALIRHAADPWIIASALVAGDPLDAAVLAGPGRSDVAAPALRAANRLTGKTFLTRHTCTALLFTGDPVLVTAAVAAAVLTDEEVTAFFRTAAIAGQAAVMAGVRSTTLAEAVARTWTCTDGWYGEAAREPLLLLLRHPDLSSEGRTRLMRILEPDDLAAVTLGHPDADRQLPWTSEQITSVMTDLLTGSGPGGTGPSPRSRTAAAHLGDLAGLIADPGGRGPAAALSDVVLKIAPLLNRQAPLPGSLLAAAVARCLGRACLDEGQADILRAILPLWTGTIPSAVQASRQAAIVCDNPQAREVLRHLAGEWETTVSDLANAAAAVVLTRTPEDRMLRRGS
jgi:hypothetical protein